jgi:hypothetical protein
MNTVDKIVSSPSPEPEVIAPEMKPFELKAILMILARNNLGESHIHDKIMPIFMHLAGPNAVHAIANPSDFQRLLEKVTGMIIDQYPELGEVLDRDATDLHIVPDVSIDLASK